MPTLMERYQEYNNRLKARGIKMVSYQCPCCSESIETQPAPKGEKWDTLSECPHCNRLYMKFTDGSRAYGLIPEA